MKRLALLLILCIGCAHAATPPAEPDATHDTVRPTGKARVKPSEMWEALADSVEQGDFDTTNAALKCVVKTAKRLNVPLPERYDAAMQQYMANKPLDYETAKKLAATLRGFKTQ